MKRIPFFFLCLLLTIGLNGQEYLGTWTSHLPYNAATGLAVAGEKTFCISKAGMFYYNTSDNSINKLSKESGLSDTEISSIAYSEETGNLLIAYKNANLDILKNNTVFNLPDIKRKQILGDKTIYHIYLDNELAYLSCGFGIVVLDIERREIKETYLIGEGGSQVKVNSVSSFEGNLYAATEEGLFFASLDAPNLSDFNNWNKISRFSKENQRVSSLVSGPGEMYFILTTNSDTDSLYWYSDNSWDPYPHFQKPDLVSLNYDNDQLIVCTSFEIDVFNKAGENVKHFFIGKPLNGELDDENGLWIADNITGLIYISDSGLKLDLVPEGPAGVNTADLQYRNGLLLGVAGGTTLGLDNIYRSAEVYSYRGKKWGGIRIDSLKDLTSIAIDPSDTSHFYTGSWGYGLLEFKDGEMINHYTSQNSTLQSIFPGDYFYRLGGIQFDRDGNLWITNSGVADPISVLTPDGEWISFPVSSSINASNMGKIIITQQNHKWIILPGGNGLFVFDDKGTLENPDDDEMKKISVRGKNNKIITNDIYSIAEDRKGNIWLGTNMGILVYYSPGRVFEGDNFYAQQIIVPRNDGSGLGDPLLKTEIVTSITVDGANRKWIGTRNGGAFLVSEDGLEEVHAFNINNSPLLSNSITDIAVNDDNGEVFFGTNSGIISFVSDATEPDEFFSDVYVYPNPVRESYNGNIVVAGLIEDTYVKFTDLNGNLVYETRSRGGQAVWNGNNFNGERVSTGIYLVFCSNDDGSQTHVTKLLFIN